MTLASSAMGSSPRVRGAVQTREVRQAQAGIIPARAGSRPKVSERRPSSWDHPRACGEQTRFWLGTTRTEGSSPRVRGAATRLGCSWPATGIIPARAGSSMSKIPKSESPRDHPRACGEQPKMHGRTSCLQGSSPRVRGAGGLLLLPHQAPGIIPARAGSRVSECLDIFRLWDHPRACGEQSTNHVHNEVALGSSPRVRGAGT